VNIPLPEAIIFVILIPRTNIGIKVLRDKRSRRRRSPQHEKKRKAIYIVIKNQLKIHEADLNRSNATKF
jgi:hypothetical protein